MKPNKRELLIAASVAVSALMSVNSQAAVLVLPTPCSVSGVNTQMKILGRSSTYNVTRDFSGGIENGIPYPAGTFGPQPLFSTSFTAGGTTGSCVVVTLSANVRPNDNATVFQARVDGIPMGGQWNPATYLAASGNFAGVNQPIVMVSNVVDDGVNAALDPPHLVSYTFYANVAPGPHTIDVRAAGCCHADINVPAGTPDGFIYGATLKVENK